MGSRESHSMLSCFWSMVAKTVQTLAGQKTKIMSAAGSGGGLNQQGSKPKLIVTYLFNYPCNSLCYLLSAHPELLALVSF